jgi:hypothetical protein
MPEARSRRLLAALDEHHVEDAQHRAEVASYIGLPLLPG